MLKPTKLAEAVAPGAVWLVKKPPISGKKGLPVWSQFFISQGRKGNDPSTAKRVASEIHVPTPLFGWLTRATANRKTNSNQTTRPFGFTATANPAETAAKHSHCLEFFSSRQRRIQSKAVE